jgi:4-hydroxy-tetrahydrodipicolinate synthase
MLPHTTAELSQHPRIVAIKEAVAGAARVREILTLAPGFTVLSGDDPTFVEAMEAGALGVISVSANLIPQRMHQIAKAALAQDFVTAKALDAPLAPFHPGLFIEPNPIPIKWALEQMGLIESGIRLPLIPLSSHAQGAMLALLQSVGVL